MSMEAGRRLSDAIVEAHEVACDEGKKEIADLLLEALELDLSAIGGVQTEHRDSLGYVERAFERHKERFPE